MPKWPKNHAIVEKNKAWNNMQLRYFREMASCIPAVCPLFPLALLPWQLDVDFDADFLQGDGFHLSGAVHLGEQLGHLLALFGEGSHLDRLTDLSHLGPLCVLAPILFRQ